MKKKKKKKRDLHYEHSMKDDHNRDNCWTLQLKLMFEGTILERHSWIFKRLKKWKLEALDFMTMFHEGLIELIR